MTTDPSFLRHVCQAKAAELAGENPKTIAKALVLIYKNSEKVQADESEKQRLFQKVVRLDPVQAITNLGS